MSAAWTNDPPTIAADNIPTKTILIPVPTRHSGARVRANPKSRAGKSRDSGSASRSGMTVLKGEALLLVTDAVDRACPVVGNQDRTILVQDDIGRPAEIALVAFDPAGCELFLLCVLAV